MRPADADSSPFLRSLGLNVFLSIFDRSGERPKIAVRRNRLTAFLRCAIHVLPVVPSVALATLNIGNFYIGEQLQGQVGKDGVKLGAIQFAAKMHELSIHASIAAMVCTYIVHQLTMGTGLPYGAIHAQLNFTAVSYLWSSDFWGAMLSNTSLRKRIQLVLVVFGAVVLANTAAPSSAIAIMPRLDLWKALGTGFWLNASNETMWPGEVNSAHTGGDRCSSPQSIYDSTCPSGGFSSIKSFSEYFVDRGYEFVPARTMPVFGTKATRNMNVTVKLGRNPDSITTATVPPSAISNALAVVGAWWPSAARFARDRKGLQYISMKDAYLTIPTFQPITRVQCSKIETRSKISPSQLQFPDTHGNGVAVTSYTDDQLWQDAFSNITVNSNTNIYWFKLPNTRTSNSTMGAAVVLPIPSGASEDTGEIYYTTCNIDSRWAPSDIWRFHKEITMTVSSAPSSINIFDIGRDENIIWPWPAISATVDWAKSLNPLMDNQNTTAFSSIAASAAVNSSPDETHPQVIEAILAMMFTDGLARIGSNATLQGHLKGSGSPEGSGDGPWVDEFINFGDAYELNSTQQQQSTSKDQPWIHPVMTVYVYGWSYSFDGFTIKIAVVILLTHAVLAFAHVCYSLFSGISSNSWDTAAEMTALALNSRPSPVMQNTCAGITRLRTMETNVRIVVTGGDHLELEFEGGHDDEIPLLERTGEVVKRVQFNKKYGAVGDEDEKVLGQAVQARRQRRGSV